MVRIRNKILSLVLSLALVVGVMAPVYAQTEPPTTEIPTTTLTVASATPDAKYLISVPEDDPFGPYDYYGKEYDGSAVIDVTLTLTGVEAGDTVTATATATLPSANVKDSGSYTTVDLTNITLTENPNSKYTIAASQSGVTLTQEFVIEPKSFPLDVTVADREYDSTNDATITAISFQKPDGYDGTTQSLTPGNVMFASLYGKDYETTGAGITEVGDFQYVDIMFNGGLDFGNFGPNTFFKLTSGRITPSTLSFAVDVSASAAKVLPGVTLTAEAKNLALTGALLTEMNNNGSAEQIAAQIDAAAKGLTYQWYKDGAPIEGATGTTYAVVEADRNHAINCKVTAHNNFTGSVTSSSFTVSDREMLTGSVEITGTPKLGETLTASAAIDQAGATLEWQWYRGNAAIEGANQSTYVVAKEDRGQTLRAVVVGNGNFQGGPENTIAIPAVAPGAPTNVRAEATSTSVTVSWDAPTDDGGSPITRYEVGFGTADSTKAFGCGLATSHTIWDLLPDTEYQLRVRAYNAVDSTSSEMQTIRTPKREVDENSITVENLEASYPYTGSQIAPEIVVKNGNITLVKDTDYTLVYGTNTEVGEGTITINFQGGYTGSVTKTFAIVQNAPTLAAPTAKGTVTFDGQPIVPGEDFNAAVLSGGSSVTGATYYVATSENVKPTDLPSGDSLPFRAGTYYIWAYFTGDDHNASAWSGASLELAIEKGVFDTTNVNWPTTLGGTYDAGKTLKDYVLVGVDSYGTFAWTNPDTVPTPAVSSYSVTFIPSDYTKQNYDVVSLNLTKDVELAIARVAGTGSVTLAGWTYGDEPNTPVPVSATNGTSGVTYRYKSTAVGAPDFSDAVPTEVGEYLVEASFPASGNYAECKAQSLFTIAKKVLSDADITWPTVQGGAYDSGKTLADYALADNAYGSFAWHSPDTVPMPGYPSYEVTFTPSANTLKNYDVSGVTLTKDVELIITALTGSGSVTLEGWTYGDAANTPVPVSATNGTDNVSYQYKTAEGSEYSGAVPTDAGDYVVKATFAAKDGYAECTAEANFTIAKKVLGDADITWPTAQGGVYDPEKTLADYVLEGTSEYGSFAWTNSETVPTTAVGSYEVTFTPNANTLKNYDVSGVTLAEDVELIITALTGSGSVTLEGWTYGDAANTPVPVSATNGTDNVSYQYKTAGGSEYSDTVPTDAGDYVVKATFAAKGDYSECTAEANFTIAKKVLGDADITWPTAQGGAYDPEKTLADYVLEGTSEYGSFAWTNSETVPTSAVGSYEVTFTPNANTSKNYDLTGVTLTKNVTLTITSLAGSGSVTLEGWTYGDAANTPVPVSATNGTDNVSYQYKTAGGSEYSDAVPTDAGDYVVKATFAAKGDYSECTAEANFTIAKKVLGDADITWPTAQGGAYDPEKTLADYVLEGTSEYGSFAWTNSETVPTTAVGGYEVTFTPNANTSKNYDLTGVTLTKNVTLTITSLAGTGSVTLAGWTYGDAANAPVPVSATNGTDNVSYQYKAAGGSEYSDAVPTDAGDYVVKATFAAKGNYSECTAEANFTIAKKEITVTPDAGQSKRMGQDDPVFTYTLAAGALVSGDTLTGALGREAGEEAGTYAYTLGTLENSNYRLLLAEETFAIVAPEVEVVVKAPTADETLLNDPDKGAAVQGMLDNTAAQAAPTGLAEATAGNLEITGDTDLSINVEINDVTMKDGKVTSITFDAAPYWTGEDGVSHLISNDQLNGGGITFRLPVPAEVTEKYAKVVHHLSDGTTETMYLEIQADGGNKYVIVTTTSFSVFEMSFVNNLPTDPVKPGKPSIPGGGSDWKWPSTSGSSSTASTDGKGNPSTGDNGMISWGVALAAMGGLTALLSIKRKKKK